MCQLSKLPQLSWELGFVPRNVGAQSPGHTQLHVDLSSGREGLGLAGSAEGLFCPRPLANSNLHFVVMAFPGLGISHEWNQATCGLCLAAHSYLVLLGSISVAACEHPHLYRSSQTRMHFMPLGTSLSIW